MIIVTISARADKFAVLKGARDTTIDVATHVHKLHYH